MKSQIASAAAALTLLFSFSAAAGVADVAPTTDKLVASKIERVLTVQKEEAFTAPAIRLVQTDNGGSSDIGSLMSPSSLYLTFHQDGEMFDIDGTYLITTSAYDVEIEKFDKKSRIIQISFKSKSEALKTIKHKMLLFVGEALDEARTAVSETNEEFQMKAYVGMQEGSL